MADGNAQAQGMHPSFVGVIRQKERIRGKLSKIKHIIGIYSAKGGVGKTTTAVNLAYALAGKGLGVGLLDADIDCPNLTMFLGINERMDTGRLPLVPLVKDGIKVVSTAMLVDELKRPIIWRGPIITKMLGDFFENTDWGELDYLILDLSPGTSDAPLTIMQLLRLDGFVIVTTPQKIAAVNSIRSGLMAKRLGVSVLGVVENMSKGAASSSTEEAVRALETRLLGTIVLDGDFNRLSDQGKIPVLESASIAKQFELMAEQIVEG